MRVQRNKLNNLFGASASSAEPNPSVEIQAKSKSFNLSRVGPSASGPIQLAGHAGVMIFGNEGRLTKRIEENEYKQFQKVRAMQLSDAPRVAGVFPNIHKVYKGDELNKAQIRKDYGDGDSVVTWLEKHNDASDYYVEMESLGGADVDILDFKIGRETASKWELETNYGRSEGSAKKKVKKMSGVDNNSETARYGLRDSDALKNQYYKAFRRWCGVYESTLDAVDERLKQDERKFGKGKVYPEGSQALEDLRNIHQYILHADTMYIASSLIMKWTKNRENRKNDRVVLIDLAHPVTSDAGDEFFRIRHGMMLGILNLHAMLKGEKRSAKLQDVAVPAKT